MRSQKLKHAFLKKEVMEILHLFNKNECVM